VQCLRIAHQNGTLPDNLDSIDPSQLGGDGVSVELEDLRDLHRVLECQKRRSIRKVPRGDPSMSPPAAPAPSKRPKTTTSGNTSTATQSTSVRRTARSKTRGTPSLGKGLAKKIIKTPITAQRPPSPSPVVAPTQAPLGLSASIRAGPDRPQGIPRIKGATDILSGPMVTYSGFLAWITQTFKLAEHNMRPTLLKARTYASNDPIQAEHDLKDDEITEDDWPWISNSAAHHEKPMLMVSFELEPAVPEDVDTEMTDDLTQDTPTEDEPKLPQFTPINTGSGAPTSPPVNRVLFPSGSKSDDSGPFSEDEIEYLTTEKATKKLTRTAPEFIKPEPVDPEELQRRQEEEAALAAEVKSLEQQEKEAGEALEPEKEPKEDALESPLPKDLIVRQKVKADEDIPTPKKGPTLPEVTYVNDVERHNGMSSKDFENVKLTEDSGDENKENGEDDGNEDEDTAAFEWCVPCVILTLSEAG
jgi:hypothetical protein